MITLKSLSEIEIMRRCGHAVAAALKAMGERVEPGITTAALNEIGEATLASMGAVPSFKGYRGFPAGVCISVNEEVVHGIPGNRTLQSGDVVSLDIGASLEGLHADGAWTFSCGEISPEARRLLNVTKESLFQGLAQARAGNRIGDISRAIQAYVEQNGYSVIRDLSGHGIGRNLHEEPSVPNFGRAGTGERLKAGMTICIEPMVCAGRYRVRTLSDNWTVVTADGSLAAHFEHTVVVTDGPPDILTISEVK